MTSGAVTFLLFIGFILWLGGLFAVLRLFSIDSSLKLILAELRAQRTTTEKPLRQQEDSALRELPHSRTANWNLAAIFLVVGVVVGVVILVIVGVSR